MNTLTGFQYYWELVRKRFLLLVLASVVVAVLALVIARRIEPVHEVHFSYIVSLTSRDAAPEFRFDGYYALQATDLFASTLAKWLTTPETVVAAYDKARQALPSNDPRALSRTVRAEKAAPQLVTVTVRGADAEAAQKLSQGLMAVMEDNIAEYQEKGVPAVKFAAVATEPWTGVTRVSVPVVVVASFVFTFLIALNGVLLLESLRSV